MANKSLIQKLFGTKQEKDLRQLYPIVESVNARESWAQSLSKDDFPAQTALLKERVQTGTPLSEVMVDAFALAREAAFRVLGERHYDVQIMGAAVLHQGSILEMKTGEGKTLTCVPAAYLNALEGKGVHIVTVNDYLAERDASWMGPVFAYLGLSVGVILSNMDNEQRRISYASDITYGTNNEFGFDYLRDNMKWSAAEKIQPKHHYCIVDEIDSILIDEARTPLIISGQAEDDSQIVMGANRIVPLLTECEKDPETGEYPEENTLFSRFDKSQQVEETGDYRIDEKHKRITFTKKGLLHIEELLQKNKLITGSLYDDENFEYVHYVTQAVKAHKLFHLDVDYVVADKQVQIVDEFTGRVLHGRRYSDGLHQAIEAKERIKILGRNKTLATITFQNFFRMYDKISGMTGTADTEATEFRLIYGLDVVVIPTHKPVIREDNQDVIYFNEPYKLQAICNEIARVHATGQPILVGTVSIEKSELIASLLRKMGIPHEVLNAKNHAREALIIEEAGAKGAVTIATNMAGRGTDIKLGGSLESRARRLVGTDATPEELQKAMEKVYPEWKKAYEEVKGLGGLYILGTERHESRRIDNQLRGRSGRQGDPGVSRFYLSLDDTLMRLFAKDNLKAMLGRIGMTEGEPLEHSMLSKAIERAQKRVEEQNFDIRKHLLEYDDVLNEQRNFIYNQRDQILEESDVVGRALNSCHELTQSIVEECFNEGTKRTAMLADRVMQQFQLTLALSEQELEAMSKQDTLTYLDDFIEKEVRAKMEITGEKVFNDFMRFQYLRQIDTRWQDHLEQLEALRESVSLRSFAQKNPLLEYKLEGSDIFDEMLSEIKHAVARILVRVQIRPADSPMQPKRGPERMVERHDGPLQFGSSAAPQAHQAPVQVKRTVPKVGRNEPCPCGSGKKYKHCHGQ